MSTKQNGEKSIFKEALKLKTAAERKAYVEKICADDPALKARIFALLRAHEDKGDFLETLLEPVVTIDDQELKEKPGTVIGRYKLLEKIGEGGMAVVYMAEQQEPINRKVALKIIKLGMDTKSVIARFEAERQALAMMDHPNVAKVFDAGATESGRPYFVMELVEGSSITTYCDQNRLGTKERLGLFIQVCNAIQHAHQRGIIHRDLKPSNILITLQDGMPTPKVIDFGIAKATKQRLTEKTLFTRYAQMIGTPAYMSPEQAELSDLEIDIRTDIYSLGVLLYELLTGTTPFSEEQLRKAGYIEMQRIICQQEPAKPSTKLTTLGEKLTDIAEHRGSAPDVLTKAVQGDLDWIVMKSLEKDRSRRYETADAFAGDIQRHLEDKPILARPPELMYRLRKFLRRNRLQAAAVLMLVLLGVAIAFSLSIWNRYQHHLAESESFTHKQILTRARKLFSERDFPAAFKYAESILKSDHVGPEAQLLYAGILVDSNEPNDAAVRLKKLLNEKPEIASAARSLLDRINLEFELVEVDKLARVTSPIGIALPEGKAIYVDANATGTNDGSSWDNAYKYLQDALAAASRGDQIKVAAGVYKPDQGAGITRGDREATFQLKSGVAVYGGINGGKSILSGDLNGDDGSDFAGNDENSYHVVRARQADETTVLDGFTITAGNANGEIYSDQARGGGMSCRPGSPTVANCIFSGNAAQHGGGMFNEFESKPTVTDCTFIGNKAYVDGGGMFNLVESCPTVTDCNFVSNSAGQGAGMKNDNHSNSTVINCAFRENKADFDGGGMFNQSESYPKVSDCNFINNSAEDGGGMKNDNHSNPTVTNCTFNGNSAQKHGGGMRNRENSNPIVTNCTFISNSAKVGGGIFNRAGSPIVTNCTFNSNIASGGGGMGNEGDSNPEIINCTFTENSAQLDGGGIRNWSSSTIKNCIFTRNSAGETGGGGIFNSGCSPLVEDCIFSCNSASKGGGMGNRTSSPTLTKCTFTENSAEQGGGMDNQDSTPIVTDCSFTGNSVQGKGGGMFNHANSNLVIINGTFTGNSADNGGGMYNRSSSPKATNCTFTDNAANTDGGGIFNTNECEPIITNCTLSGNSAGRGGAMYSREYSSSILTNCILWGNTANNGPQIALQDDGSVTVKYCDLQGGQPEIDLDETSFVNWDLGNIGADPLFVNVADTDYHLQANSPCIDAGDSSVIPESVIEDLDGNPRIMGRIVDMGAYEYRLQLMAFNPIPADGVTDVTQTPILSWTAGERAVLHDVYFGTDEQTVRDATLRSPEYKVSKDLGSESYEPGELQWGITYYWRVDEYNTDETISKGSVWGFTVIVLADPLAEAMDIALKFTTGGSSDWFPQTITSYTDGDAAQSGYISHGQESWMQTTVSGAGMFSFSWKVSSEAHFDFLEFYIDGSLQDRISGSVDWHLMTYEINGSDIHTLEWRYVKDKSQTRGSDCGWVDNIMWAPTP